MSVYRCLGINLININSFPRSVFIINQQGHWVQQEINLLGQKHYTTVICFHGSVQSEDTILSGVSSNEHNSMQSETCLLMIDYKVWGYDVKLFDI